MNTCSTAGSSWSTTLGRGGMGTTIREIKRCSRTRAVELPLSHPIFHAVFDLKEKPQIPSIDVAMAGRSQGITWERPDAREVHYKAINDDKGRMMAISCPNTDLGDGWEREGENEWSFMNSARRWRIRGDQYRVLRNDALNEAKRGSLIRPMGPMGQIRHTRPIGKDTHVER